jgi:predicted DNA-binding transcriptional regulator AlpA
MSARFLTETEVSERTHISLGTLRRWRLENKGPRYHKFGWLVRYAEDDLASWEAMQLGGDSGVDRIGPSPARPLARLRRSG